MSITLSGLTNPCLSSCFAHVLHLGSAAAERLDQVVRFGLHHAHVVGTLDNQSIGWAIGHLCLEFWNWPPLSEQFQTELIQRLSGHKILYLSGKL